MGTTMVERLDRATGEFTTEEQDLDVVELGGDTPLQLALADAVRAEYVNVTETWCLGVEEALKLTRDRSGALLKGLLNEAMQNLNEVMKGKQMRLELPAERRPGDRP